MARIKKPDDCELAILNITSKEGAFIHCNNYSEIQSIAKVIKIFSLLILNRLHGEVDTNLRDEQAAFRKRRSYRDQCFKTYFSAMFNLQNALTGNAVVDYEKRLTLAIIWKIVLCYGIPINDITFY